jgi:hypothetical protein
MSANEEIYVRPSQDEFEVLAPGHRRGPRFATQELAIEHAAELAPLVLVLNRTGKVEREVRPEGDLTALVAEYYAALEGLAKDSDGHWSILERWSYGKHLGWFVEHDGHSYGGLDDDGEDGPYPTREAAIACMSEHLQAAIAGARERLG